MADRVAQGALALTSLSSTGALDAAAKADRTSLVASALTSMSTIAGAETGSAAVMASIQKMRMTADAASGLNADSSALNDAPRITSIVDAGKVNAALATTSLSATQTSTTTLKGTGAARPDSPRTVADGTSGLETEQASRNSGGRAIISASMLAQGECAALNEAPRIRSVSGYGQLDHLNMTIEDAIILTVEITDTITLDLSIEG